MASGYSYYQRSVPGWGTNQFQFGPPPTPTFQPQPSWGGADFYRAHAANADPYLYNHAWSRVRGHHNPDIGVGTHEARHWHRRAYGGMNEANRMLPSEIGHAAAYEAYRTWIHHSPMYEPLSGDTERQREGLVGLAVAEATRLMQYIGRSFDSYGRMEATDAAGATASIIFYQSRENDDPYYSRSRSRRSSFSSSPYDDPYSYDDRLMFPHSDPYHRSHSRPRSHSHSRVRTYSHSSAHAPIPYASSAAPIPIHGGGHGVVPTGYAGSYNPSYGAYPASYSGHYGPQQMLALPSSYDNRHRSGSLSAVPAAYPMTAGVPVVVSSSGRKSKHRHSHSSSKRSRSSDPIMIEYAGSSRY